MLKKSRISPTLRERIRLWSCAVMAVACFACLYAGAWSLSAYGHVRFDWSQDQLSVLSRETASVLSGLDQDVEIILVFQQATDNDHRRILEIITESYAQDPHVKKLVVDPVREPGKLRAFAENGSTITEGTMLVTNAAHTRTMEIAPSDCYVYRMSTSGAREMTGIAVERKLTLAIQAVTKEQTQRVVFLTGHDEADMASCTQLISSMQESGYQVTEISLTQSDALRADDVLLVLSPNRDMTADEQALMMSFLDEGGRMLLCMDASLDLDTMPRFRSIAERYSLTFVPGLVVEDERSRDNWINTPMYLMPTVCTETEAMAGFPAKHRILMPAARPIAGPDIPRSGYTYQTLLTTSELAYLKQMTSETSEWEEGDPRGPWQLAVSVTHAQDDGREMRLILMGSLYTVMDNGLLSASYNLDAAMQMMSFLSDKEAPMEVPVKTAGATSIAVPSTAEGYRMLAITLILPVLTLFAAVIILHRRKRQR